MTRPKIIRDLDSLERNKLTKEDHSWNTLQDKPALHDCATSGFAKGSIVSTSGGRNSDTDANLPIQGDGKIRHLLSTSSMTANKPVADGYITHYAWDNNGGYEAEFFISNSANNVLQHRGMTKGVWGDWITVYDSRNFAPVNNLTSTSSTTPLAAAQGKALNDELQNLKSTMSSGSDNRKVFTSNGTFTVPSGVTAIWVTACGGGQGGSGRSSHTTSAPGNGRKGSNSLGEGGYGGKWTDRTVNNGKSSGGGGGAFGAGGGGASSSYVDTANNPYQPGNGGKASAYILRHIIKVTPGTNIPITIGTGGRGAGPGAVGGAGGNTIIGNYLTIPGGSSSSGVSTPIDFTPNEMHNGGYGGQGGENAGAGTASLAGAAGGATNYGGDGGPGIVIIEW